MAAAISYNTSYYNSTTGLAKSGYPRVALYGVTQVPFEHTLVSTETDDAGDRIFLIPLPKGPITITRFSFEATDPDTNATETIDLDFVVTERLAGSVASDVILLNSGTLFEDAVAARVVHPAASVGVFAETSNDDRNFAILVNAPAATFAAGVIKGVLEYVRGTF